ncbi:MAG: neutral zinc metallopeptidase [Propionibacteriaceae bacterium]|jgi:predicted metalloprotease|nr:neutral zinc metallopeptidase [Propionibacteriaceae bacterium]
MTFSSGGSFKGGRVRKGGVSTGAKVGGGVGVGGLLIVTLVALLGGPSDLVANLLGTGTSGSGTEVISGDNGYVEACTADQANSDRECRLSATVQALDAYWATALPAQGGVQYTLPDVVSFQDAVSTACGNASAASGPFYCPGDQTIYIDVSFYDLLTSQYGASGGPLAEEYVVAHEMGHHIENELGYLDRAANDEGADSDSVKIELMADCLAGMWAGSAASTVDPNTGTTFLDPITDAQLQDALSAASAVGDDHIQQQAGYINPESFTHGTSAQRQYWFTIGYNNGSIAQCDTFQASTLDPH